MRLFGPLARRAQAIHGTRQRELRRPETGDEVAAPDPARILHRFQNPVRRGETAAHPLRTHDLACKDPVSFEQLSDLRGRALGRRDRRVPRGLGEGPPSGDVISHGEALEAADVHRPADRIGSARPAKRRQESAHRVEAVVRDLACPDEVPQRVAELGRESAARRGEELWEERRASRLQHLAKAIVDRAVRTCLRCGPQK